MGKEIVELKMERCGVQLLHAKEEPQHVAANPDSLEQVIETNINKRSRENYSQVDQTNIIAAGAPVPEEEESHPKRVK